jgi:integrase
MPLTIKEIGAAKPRPSRYRLSDGNGLHLQVEPNGSKLWRLRYRHTGVEKMLALGRYPEVSLKLARERCYEARRQLSEGIDPNEARLSHRHEQEAQKVNTFEAAAKAWFDRNHSRSVVPEHARRNWRRLEVYALPWLGSLPTAEITARNVLDVLRPIDDQGRTETAHRVKSVIGQVMRYAIALGTAERDPTRDLRDALPPSKPEHHPAVTTPEELADLLISISAYAGDPITRAALRLSPLLLVRPGELRSARWSDIDLHRQEWRVTAKGGVDHLVPLAPQAIEIIESLRPLTGRSDYLLESQRSRGRPMSGNTINAALHRLGYKDVATGHGFRATARTMLVERLGYSVEIVEMQLAHRVRDVHGRAYNRTQWVDQRREMMTHWAQYLAELEADARRAKQGGR